MRLIIAAVIVGIPTLAGAEITCNPVDASSCLEASSECMAAGLKCVKYVNGRPGGEQASCSFVLDRCHPSGQFKKDALAGMNKNGGEAKKPAGDLFDWKSNKIDPEWTAEARTKKKQDALADCGKSPEFVGGPWFSSTYESEGKRAVVRDDRFLCIKKVEYVRSESTPFGANRAIVKYTGYHQYYYTPLTANGEFLY